MTGLAEFVMRGRWQALLIAVAGSASTLFCWISAAVIALITLRKGVGPGVWLFLWALLPAGTLIAVYGDGGPLALLAGTLLLALVLRTSVSLALAVLVSVAVGLVSALAFAQFATEYLAAMAELFGQFIATMSERAGSTGEAQSLPQISPAALAGMLGGGTATMAVLSLFLARYWQAALYNPGGFGQEFRSLYYPVGVAAALVIAGLLLSSVGTQMRSWAMIFFIPLTFAGLALVHSWAAYKGRSGVWMTWFYIAWLILDPLKLLVVGFAVVDSWLDFRSRWAERDERLRRRLEEHEADAEEEDAARRQGADKDGAGKNSANKDGDDKEL